MRTFEGHTAWVTTLKFSRDGLRVVSGGWDGVVRLWEVATGNCVQIFEGHTLPVTTVAFSLDGRWVLSGSNDGNLRLWEVATGKCIRIFGSEGNPVDSVAISADSRWAFSGNRDKTLRLWEIPTGKCLRILEAHSLYSLDLSNCSRYVLTGNSDGRVRLWELDWELEAVGPADWDESARPYLRNFLTVHTPYGGNLPERSSPSEEDKQLALTRRGKPSWSDDDFKDFLYTLGCAGYGWLRPEGVKKELEKMAKDWEEPPPLFGETR